MMTHNSREDGELLPHYFLVTIILRKELGRSISNSLLNKQAQVDEVEKKWQMNIQFFNGTTVMVSVISLQLMA